MNRLKSSKKNQDRQPWKLSRFLKKRIGNLGNSSTMKARLQEEVRLVELAQGTRERYTGMGVFSAGECYE